MLLLLPHHLCHHHLKIFSHPYPLQLLLLPLSAFLWYRHLPFHLLCHQFRSKKRYWMKLMSLKVLHFLLEVHHQNPLWLMFQVMPVSLQDFTSIWIVVTTHVQGLTSTSSHGETPSWPRRGRKQLRRQRGKQNKRSERRENEKRKRRKKRRGNGSVKEKQKEQQRLAVPTKVALESLRSEAQLTFDHPLSLQQP